MSEAAKELITAPAGRSELGEIPLTLTDSTLPILRGNVSVLVSVSNDVIQLKSVPRAWDGSVESLVKGAGDSEIYELDLTTKDRVRRVVVSLNKGRITVFHEDPFGVEENFETIFSSNPVYWIKAFRKMLQDRFGITAEDDLEGFEGEDY